MKNSSDLYKKALNLIPGGVNSPVRAGKAVGVEPLFIAGGKGPYIWDVEGRPYVDYVCSWGPLILGHARKEIVEAIHNAAIKGTSFGAPTELEVEMAQIISELVPSIEKVRMVNSGTEAVMSAIRLARAYTGKEKIIKFDGCYHGHLDSLLVSAGSGLATFGIPASPGVPKGFANTTISLPYNEIGQVKKAFEQWGNEIAGVIVEPIAGNMGVVLPKEGFLEGLRTITKENGALLIFDEVITGFRVSLGGAQGYFNIYPDLTCLGKIIGGGLPVGAYGGKAEIMDMVAPQGQVYQAGTLSGNPVAMAAGLETLRILKKNPPYAELEENGKKLFNGLESMARELGLEVCVNSIGSMGTLFFSQGPVVDWETARLADTSKYARFYQEMLKEGIYLPPSQFEAMMLSTAHTNEEIQKTLEAAKKSLKKLL